MTTELDATVALEILGETPLLWNVELMAQRARDYVNVWIDVDEDDDVDEVVVLRDGSDLDFKVGCWPSFDFARGYLVGSAYLSTGEDFLLRSHLSASPAAVDPIRIAIDPSEPRRPAAIENFVLWDVESWDPGSGGRLEMLYRGVIPDTEYDPRTGRPVIKLSNRSLDSVFVAQLEDVVIDKFRLDVNVTLIRRQLPRVLRFTPSRVPAAERALGVHRSVNPNNHQEHRRSAQ